MNITPEELKKYEEALLALRDQLSHEIKEVIRDSDIGAETQPEEESDEDEERGTAFAIQISLKEQLAAVLDALQKVKNSTYGICEKCKQPIGADVLKADSASRYCKHCKTQKA